MENLIRYQEIVYDVPFLGHELNEFVLWFFTGTRCNLECTHCYVNSSPENNDHPYLKYDTFKQQLDIALENNFSKIDIYFTGGEPFINPDILQMIDESLNHGNTTILTNGTRFSESTLETLRNIVKDRKYSLTFRISLDGPNKEEHDMFRGEGSFDKTMQGLKNVSGMKIDTIITAMRSWEKFESENKESEFISLFTESGIPQEKQKLKILPPLRIGRESVRSRSYNTTELFTEECFTEYDYKQLQCSKCRMVTEKGVWVCPILVNEEGAKMSNDINGSFKPFGMKYAACWTCRMDGMSCEN